MLINKDKKYSVHVDCDNFWVYEKEFGLKSITNPDYMYDISLRKLIDLFNKYEIKATFFIIAKDLDRTSCVNFCKDALQGGHKIGNHSLNHPMNFGILNSEERKSEIIGAHNLILKKLNYQCKSFRAPGYGVKNSDLNVLADLGYFYDSSVLPGYTALIIKISTLHLKEYRKKSLSVFQNLFESTAPRKHILQNNLRLWRVPISVFPFLRLPVHTSFLFLLGPQYLRIFLFFIRFNKNPEIILFHGLDLAEQMSNKNKNVIPVFNTAYQKRFEICNILLEHIKNKTLHLEENLN